MFLRILRIQTPAMRKLACILRFYSAAMLFPCVAASVALAWLVVRWGPSLSGWCFVAKVVFDALFLYVLVLPRYGNLFPYYLNLGIRRRWLLGVSCAADLLFYLLLAGPLAGFIHGNG